MELLFPALLGGFYAIFGILFRFLTGQLTFNFLNATLP